ncbi:MAG: aminotransferase class V-fold PLP-dependent enzyme [Planctomycetota bacterium]
MTSRTIAQPAGLPTTRPTIRDAVAALGDGPLAEPALREHVDPLFSRVLARDEIYLANHSLGRPLDRMADDVAEFTRLWYEDMDAAWDAWLGELTAFRAMVARLIGCGREDAVVHKVSAGQGLRAVINAMPTKGSTPSIVSTAAEFDAVDTILRAYAQKGRASVRWVEADDDAMIRAESVTEAITPETDLVVVSRVYFNTGQVLEGLDDIVEAAHRVGAAVLVDTYHSAGVIPGDFDRSRADFAIGGNYKYTRGGPGASWLAIREDHLDDPAWQPIDTGWFAKDSHFDFARGRLRLAPGGDGWNEGTPAPLIAYQARSGLEFTLAVGVDRLRSYSVSQLQGLAERLSAEGLSVRTHAPRGAFLCVDTDNHTGDHAAARARLKQLGVNSDSRTDARGRGIIRLCPDVLTTTDELDRAAPLVRDAILGH